MPEKNQNKFKNKITKEVYDIPDTGSLALLAYGYVGLIEWRKKKGVIDKHQKQRIPKPKE